MGGTDRPGGPGERMCCVQRLWRVSKAPALRRVGCQQGRPPERAAPSILHSSLLFLVTHLGRNCPVYHAAVSSGRSEGESDARDRRTQTGTQRGSDFGGAPAGNVSRTGFSSAWNFKRKPRSRDPPPKTKGHVGKEDPAWVGLPAQASSPRGNGGARRQPLARSRA